MDIFHLSGNISVRVHVSKIIWRGVTIAVSQILIMRGGGGGGGGLPSQSLDLLGSRAFIKSRIFSGEIVTEKRQSAVLVRNTGNSSLVSMGVR